MKRVPSFSSRPDFPAGLQVLLYEPAGAHSIVRNQLEELSYVATCCATPSEVVSQLGSSRTFDLVVAEVRAALADSGGAKAMMQESSTPIVAALDGLPLVLMTSEGGSQQEVWRSIELGAADCLEKPLSPLKLRNIWQHVVRKMMAGGDPAREGKGVEDKKKGYSGGSPRAPSSANNSVPELDLTVSDGSSKRGEVASSTFSDAADLLSFDLGTADSGDVCLSDIKPRSKPLSSGDPFEESKCTGSPNKRPRRCKATRSPAPLPSLGPSTKQAPSPIRPTSAAGLSGGPAPAAASTAWGAPAFTQGSAAWPGPFQQSMPMAWQGGLLPAGVAPMIPSPMQRTCSAPVGPMAPLGGSFGRDRSYSTASELVADRTMGLESLSMVCQDAAASDSHKPPLGLLLRKSDSFLDLVNEQLRVR